MAQETPLAAMKRAIRQLAKTIAVKSGGLSLFHRLKDRERLTVAMFHRVLPEHLMTAADEEYTISTALLARFLEFAAAYYNIVSLDDVLRSRRKEAPLPSLPLLITFDDGWDDNATHAAPVLAAASVPWTLFAATDAISSGERWWQEDLLAALRTGRTSYTDLWTLAAGDSGPRNDRNADPELSILVLYGTLPPAKRDDLLNRHLDGSSMQVTPRHMADWDTLRALQKSGVSIGGHGASHLPLTMLADPVKDLRQACSIMREQLGEDACTTMSFPHGRYNTEIAGAARGLGMQLLFTSDPVLNKCTGGWLESDLIGRISISTASVADDRGRLELARAMPWLMLRQ
jgi:peptidoglycan/xylan/chitin deacetylase (PgdA/CDA1 family)